MVKVIRNRNKKGKKNKSPQVNPNSYFEQLEPRIILGSCLAFGGVEALAGEAHADVNPYIYVAPPPEFNQVNPQRNFQPSNDIPSLFSWNAVPLPFEFLNNQVLPRASSKPTQWFAPPPSGADISDKLKLKSAANSNKKFMSGTFNNPSGSRLINPQTVTTPSGGINDPAVYPQPPGSSQPVIKIDPGAPPINPPVIGSLVLGASGNSQVKVGEEYELNLSARGPGSETIKNWTIDWGDGMVEDIIGNPDKAIHSYQKSGDYIIKTSATNADKTYSGSSVPVKVTENRQPEFINDPDILLQVERKWTFEAKAVDPDGDTVTYSLISGPEGMTIDSGTGLMTWTPRADYLGNHPVVIQATDEYGAFSRKTFILTVVELIPNRPPNFTSTPNTSADGRTLYNYQATAIDPDGDDLVFRLMEPATDDTGAVVAGLAVSESGLVTWNVPTEMIGRTITVKLEVSDGNGGSAVQYFQILVRESQKNNSPKIVTQPPESIDLLQSTQPQEVVADTPKTTDPNKGAIYGQTWVDVNGNGERDRFNDTSSYINLAEPGDVVLGRNDDGSSGAIEFGFAFEFFGSTYTKFYINNNGNITFTGPYSRYTPQGFTGNLKMIAPFWADVDTRGSASDMVRLTRGTSQRGNSFVQIDWRGVGYYSHGTDKLNDFTLYIEDDPDGDLVAFIYRDMKWTTGGASGGSGGFGGYPANIGFDAGDGKNYQSWGRPNNPEALAEFSNKTILFRIDDNGVPEPFTEPGIDGFLVELINAATGKVVDSQITKSYDLDGNGHIHSFTESGLYRFDNVEPGDYIVRQAPRSGFYQTTPTEYRVTVEAGQAMEADLGFGNRQLYEYQASALDADGDMLTWHLVEGPPDATIDARTGLLQWAPLVCGSYSFIIEVTDGRGGVDRQSFTVAVGEDDTNIPPVIISTPSNRIGSGQTYSYRVQARDANLDTLTYSLLEAPEGASINHITGQLTWTPRTDQLGSYNFVIRVQDPRGGVDTQSFSVQVIDVPANASPTIISTPPAQVQAGNKYTYNLAATDPENDAFSWSLVQSPEGMQIQEVHGSIWWTPTASQIGKHDVIVRLVDSQGGVAIQRFQIEVLSSNVAPVITSTPPVQTEPDLLYHYQVLAEDVNGDSISFSLDEASITRGMRINANTGLMTWEQPVRGVYQVSIRATDSFDAYSEQTFLLEVGRNIPASITSEPPYIVNIGDEYVYAVTTFDPDSENVTISISPDSSISGMVLDSSTDTIRWTPTAVGEYRLTVTALDEKGAGMAQTFTIYVVAAADNRAPVISSSPLITASVEEPYVYQVIAEDPDAGDILSYELDQASISRGMEIDQNGRVYWSLPLIGTHRITIFVRDNHGFSVIQSYDLVVTETSKPPLFGGNQPAEITSRPGTVGIVGQEYQYAITAVDPEGGAISIRLDDASAAAGAYIDNGVLHWTPASEGIFNLAITAVDESGAGQTQAWSVLVVANQASNLCPEIKSQPGTRAVVGQEYQYNMLAIDPNGDVLNYSLGRAPDGMTIDSATGQLRFTPATLGTFTVEVLVSDGYHTLMQSWELSVLHSLPPTIISMPKLVANLGEEYVYEAKAVNNNGGDISWTLENCPSGASIDQSNGRLSFTPDMEGAFSITVVASDGHGGYSRQTYDLLVRSALSNRPPVIHSTPRGSVQIGQSWMYQPIASDPDGDHLTFRLVSGPSGMKLLDGGILSWTPTADQAGQHHFVVRIQDDGGLWVEQEADISVTHEYVNQPPIIISTPPESATAEIAWTYNAQAEDPDGDLVFWSLDQGPDGMRVDPMTGVITWKPTRNQIGVHEMITLTAFDSSGAYTTQHFTVMVRAANLPPVIHSTPATHARQGTEWVYQAAATDPEGERLVFSLGANAPDGMSIDSKTGLITYTPQLAGTFIVELSVMDPHGAIAKQTFAVVAVSSTANRPPEIKSIPSFWAQVNKHYTYQVIASDPDGDVLEYGLRVSPAGMSIGADGLVTWAPTSQHIGDHRVEITVSDGKMTVTHSYMLHVLLNSAPSFSSIPDQTVMAGQVFQLDAAAKDPDKDVLTYDLIEAPEGLTVDQGGRIRWHTSAAHSGSGNSNYNVVLRATDPFGETAQAAFTITVLADTVAPEVALTANKGPAAINDPVSFFVRATDAVGVVKIALFVDGKEVPVNSQGVGTVAFPQNGEHIVVARAWDKAGNMGEKTLKILIINPADQQPPIVSWNVPSGLVVNDTTDIVATVYDPDSEVVNWVLTLRSVDSDIEHLLTSGSGKISNQLLDSLDATLWANGPYILTLTAEDGAGHKTWISETVIIKSQYKLGNFNLNFQDMEVNVGGIPIVIQRTYDTFESGVNGDFGYGWNMSYIPVSFMDNIGTDIRDDPVAALYVESAWYHGTKLTIQMPDGTTSIFTVQAQEVPFVNNMCRLTFVPESGVDATLTLEGNPIVMIDDDGRFFIGSLPFNPASKALSYDLILTMADGARYRLNGRTGNCSRVDTPGGEYLDVSESGIRSYDKSGAIVGEVKFLRDDQGRVTAIIDPSGGKQITYEYSAEGDLIAVHNPDTGRVKLTYLDDFGAPKHYLKSIVDQREITLIEVQYDYVTGRITSITGADGSSVGVNFVQKVGPGLNAESVTDVLGRVTETVMDKNGKIVRTIKHAPDPANPGNRDKLSYYITIEEFDGKGNSLGTARPFTVTEEQLRALGQNQYSYVPADLFWENRSTVDAKGNITSSTDAYGHTTYYSYDKNGNQLKTVDSLGQVTENKYDAQGRLNQTINSDGSKSVYLYDSKGNVKSITQIRADGVELPQNNIEYNNDGKPDRMVDETNGTVTLFGYDSQGRQIYSKSQSKDVNNPSILREVINYQEYDSEGRVSVSWQEVNGIERSRMAYTYNDQGQTTSQTDRYGLITQYIYDINGNQIETRRQAVTETGQTVWLVSRTVYDAAMQVIWSQAEHMELNSTQAQAAKATFNVYDVLGRVVRSEIREGVLITTTGDALRQSTVVVDNGTLVGYSATAYDAMGRKAWDENAQGVKTLYFYTPQGNISHTATDIDGNLETIDDQYIIEKTLYDDYGRQIESILDIDGDWSTTGDQIVTRYVYDNQGRLTKTIYSDGTSSSVAYDNQGRKSSETDQMGRSTHYEYDAEGRLVAVVLPQVNNPANDEMVHVRYEYGYNAQGRQTSLRDNILQTSPTDQATIDRSGQRETIFTYDWQGRQSSRTLPDGSAEYFSYDAHGRQQKHISFEGRMTFYEYDQYDRLSRSTFFNSQSDFDQGRVAKAISRTYDMHGRVVKEIDTQNGSTFTSYDADGNVSRIVSPQGVINYEYDPITGQISRTWTGDGETVTDVRYTYDKLGRLETVKTLAREGAMLSTPETARYVYDLIGNLDKVIQANGVISDYQYDQFNRLKELTHYAPDDTPEDLSDNDILQRYVYAYFQDGKKSGETFQDADGQTHTWAWAYDQLGRLISEMHDNADDSLDYTTDYTYDLVGNRLLKKTDKGNDGTVDEEVRSTFDQNDRLISEIEITGGVETKRTDYIFNKTEQIAKTIIDLINNRAESKTSMEYNAQGRLSKITIDIYANGIKSQSVTQEYFYDSKGIKIRQTESIDANADGVIDGESSTNYLVDALNHTGYAQVLEERRTENGVEVKVTTYTIGHDVLSQFDTVSGFLALLYDGHGSTRAVADMGAAVLQQYSYDAYGVAHGFNAKDALTNLLYSGEQFNPVSGLQYLRARWYSPNSGRFNRLDPYFGNTKSPLSFHKYAYAHMNPVMGTDPTGLWTMTGMSMTFGIIGALAGMSIGGYLGYKETGSLFSAKTLAYIAIGGVGGFGVGILAASLAIYASPTLGKGLSLGLTSFSPSIVAVNKIILQTARIVTGGGLGAGGSVSLGSFVAGGIAGAIARLYGEKYESQITGSAVLSLGGIPIGSSLFYTIKAVRVVGIVGWAFALGFNASYFGIDAVDTVIQKIKDSE